MSEGLCKFANQHILDSVVQLVTGCLERVISALQEARQQMSESPTNPEILPGGFAGPGSRVHALGRRLEFGPDEVPLLGIFVVEDLGAA